VSMDDALFEHLCGILTERRLARFDEVLAERTRHVAVVLEDIYHAPNASAVVRTCDCLGVQDLHVIENLKRNRVNAAVVRGSSAWVTLRRHSQPGSGNTERCLAELKENGYAIAATTLREDKPLTLLEDLPLDRKLAVCFGTEQLGLSDSAHAIADYYVTLPLRGFTQSLNVSVCAALCLWTLLNRLRASDLPWRLADAERRELKAEWVWKSVKNVKLIAARFEARR